MNEPGVWGTDMEIFVLCSLFKIPHYPSSDASDFTESECIYLRNKRSHIDVVLEM